MKFLSIRIEVIALPFNPDQSIEEIEKVIADVLEQYFKTRITGFNHL